MTGSLGAYARHRKEKGLDGQSLQGVQRAIQSGRIKREKNGLIDFEKADADWAQNTKPTIGRRTERYHDAAVPEPDPEPVAVVVEESEPPAPPARPTEHFKAEHTAPSKERFKPERFGPSPARRTALPEDADNFVKARAMKEGFLAGLAQLEYRRKSGELVPIAEVKQAASDLIAMSRMRLLGVGSKLAPHVALEKDPSVCQALIEAEIYECLTALSQWDGQSSK